MTTQKRYATFVKPGVLAIFALVATLVFSTGALAFSSEQSYADSSSATDGTTLTVAMGDSGIDTLNPFLSYYNDSLNTFGMIYPSLTALDSKGSAVPYLARSWTTSTDKKTWTFTIASGLTWSDGQPITAKDAAWTLNLIMSNTVAGTANGSLVENFTSVTATDDTTLVITTKQPQSNMLYVSIPVSGIPIVPEHIWSKHVTDLKTYKNTDFPIVGYGPWQLTSYVTDQYEMFSANHSWTNGDQTGPKYDNLVIRQFKNSDAAVAALRSGQLDKTGVSATQYEALSSSDNVATYQAAGDGWAAIEVNAGATTASGQPMGTGNAALADPIVRKAIHMSIDKDKLVTDLLRGRGITGVGYLPPAWPQWSWTPTATQKVSFDITGANAMLDKAGYAKGSDGVRIDPKTKQPLVFRLGIHADNSNDASIAALMQGWLQEVGITVKIDSMSMTMLNDNLAKGDWDMLMDGWTTGPDPSYLLSIQKCDARPATASDSGMTDSFFCNEEYDKLFAQQATELDTAKRQAIIQQMQSILYDANQDIILYYADDLSGYRSSTVTNIPDGEKTDGTYAAQNAFNLYLAATPASTQASSESSNPALGVGIGIAAVILIAGVATVVVLRRRKTAGDRE